MITAGNRRFLLAIGKNVFIIYRQTTKGILMLKYNVYNTIERVKDLFRPSRLTSGPGYTAAMDARILAAIRIRADFLSGRDGRTYWYYEMATERDLDVARVLLERNGIETSIRYSGLNNYHTRLLRAPAYKIRANQEILDFVKSVNTTCSYADAKWAQDQVVKLHAQLQMDKQKTL